MKRTKKQKEAERELLLGISVIQKEERRKEGKKRGFRGQPGRRLEQLELPGVIIGGTT